MAEQSPSPGKTLAQRYFTDASVFEEEIRKIFRDRWLYVERSSAVKETGDYLTLDLEGEGLIVVRDADPSIRVHYNVCRHRGTSLLNDPSGN